MPQTWKSKYLRKIGRLLDVYRSKARIPICYSVILNATVIKFLPLEVLGVSHTLSTKDWKRHLSFANTCISSEIFKLDCCVKYANLQICTLPAIRTRSAVFVLHWPSVMQGEWHDVCFRNINTEWNNTTMKRKTRKNFNLEIRSYVLYKETKEDWFCVSIFFNNYSPKAKLILSNNPRDEVERIIQHYSLSLRRIIVLEKNCSIWLMGVLELNVVLCLVFSVYQCRGSS